MVDQNITDKTRLFGRFSYFGLLDLPTNPLGTGLCLDRCAEDYHTKALAIDFNHVFSPNVDWRLEHFRKPLHLPRAPILAGYDLTQLGWPASYNCTKFLPLCGRRPRLRFRSPMTSVRAKAIA